MKHSVSTEPQSILDPLELLDREELIKVVRVMQGNGVALTFHGKRTAMEIPKKVRPRITRRINDLHVGSPKDQSKNLLIEGENLQAMVALYEYRGQIDLVLTDPPYNTGQYFRYKDKWDKDPDDPDVGSLVPLENGSRHTKWMKAMMPRLQMMKIMLKPQGVVAICIDDNELFHLGMMMDEVFGEQNRLAIINWQKTYAPKRLRHVSSATEYVLVYAKDLDLAKTRHLDRTEEMNSRFTNPDGDPEGDWRLGDLAAQEKRDRTIYAIQSPFSGVLHYPEAEYIHSSDVSAPTRQWSGLSKSEIKSLLELWGSTYKEKDLKDGRGKALVVKDSTVSLKAYDPRCLIPAFDGAILTHELREALWARFYTGAPPRRRRSVGRYSIVKRA